MSNVVQFPGGRYAPPAPTVDALIGELAAVEIELARARLAQIQSETRQANALWGWYCFKRTVFWGFALWLLATLIAPAKADSISRSYYNERGSFAGGSVTRGNSSSLAAVVIPAAQSPRRHGADHEEARDRDRRARGRGLTQDRGRAGMDHRGGAARARQRLGTKNART
jgi:hypothetical protein